MTSAAPSAGPARPWRARARRALARLGRDLGYLLPLGLTATLAFGVCLSLALASVGTVLVWVGIPLGVATLWVARGFASLERARLRALTGIATAVYIPATAGAPALRRLLRPLRDPQMWRDLCHTIVAFPAALASWAVTVAWTAVALGGLTAAWWGPALATSVDSASGLVGWLDSTTGRTTAGAAALLTLPGVARALAALNALLSRALLAPGGESLQARVARLEQATRAAAAAEAGALRRIERDLHDGPQQHLVRLAMDIQRAARALESDPGTAREALASALEQSTSALAELRALSRGIAPPLLAERGLEAAVASLAERSTVPVALDYRAPERLPLGVETTAYFVVAESLANVAKHSGARGAAVAVTAQDGVLRVRVSDDGRGGAHVAKGQGLAGLAERVAGAGGILTVDDAPGGGTVVTAEVPCG